MTTTFYTSLSNTQYRMLTGLADLATHFVTTYGLPVLFLVFVFEGAFIGKLLPTRALLVITVILLSADLETLITLLITVTIAATLGQTIVFFLIRSNTQIDHHTHLPINDQWLTRTTNWFDRWGLPALLISNALPVGRGYLAIPVAHSQTPSHKFLIVSLAGTALYITTLILAATGINMIDPIVLTTP